MSLKLFICCAPEDLGIFYSLKKQIRPFQMKGIINDIFTKQDVAAGKEIDKEVAFHLYSAHIILLLISPDFLASDYCYSYEMEQAIERHKKGQACVIPIIVKHVHWQETPLGKLQPLPKSGIPIVDASWHSTEEALFQITDGILQSISSHKGIPIVE